MSDVPLFSLCLALGEFPVPKSGKDDDLVLWVVTR